MGSIRLVTGNARIHVSAARTHHTNVLRACTAADIPHLRKTFEGETFASNLIHEGKRKEQEAQQ